MFARLLAAALLLATSAASPAPAEPSDRQAQLRWTQRCKDWDDWSKPGPPFRVFGNTYYVGTCGISSILIDSPERAVVIDGGPADAGGLVARNIQALGVKLSHVKLLLHSHEHHDHVGGLAELRRLTGAQVFASSLAAGVLTSGKPGVDDPQYLGGKSFPPVQVRHPVTEGENAVVGRSRLVAIATPGHTPGALTWQWQSCEGTVCKTIVYADSLTPVSSDGYRFSDHPDYVAAFRASLARVAALKCDILLSPHPSASGMRNKLLAGDLGASPACKDYAEDLEKQLDERLAKEAHGG